MFIFMFICCQTLWRSWLKKNSQMGRLKKIERKILRWNVWKRSKWNFCSVTSKGVSIGSTWAVPENWVQTPPGGRLILTNFLMCKPYFLYFSWFISKRMVFNTTPACWVTWEKICLSERTLFWFEGEILQDILIHVYHLQSSF